MCCLLLFLAAFTLFVVAFVAAGGVHGYDQSRWFYKFFECSYVTRGGLWTFTKATLMFNSFDFRDELMTGLFCPIQFS